MAKVNTGQHKCSLPSLSSPGCLLHLVLGLGLCSQLLKLGFLLGLDSAPHLGKILNEEVQMGQKDLNGNVRSEMYLDYVTSLSSRHLRHDCGPEQGLLCSKVQNNTWKRDSWILSPVRPHEQEISSLGPLQGIWILGSLAGFVGRVGSCLRHPGKLKVVWKIERLTHMLAADSMTATAFTDI